MNLDADVVWGAYGSPDVVIRCERECTVGLVWRLPAGGMILQTVPRSVSRGFVDSTGLAPVEYDVDVDRVRFAGDVVALVTPGDAAPFGKVELTCNHASRVGWSWPADLFVEEMTAAPRRVVLTIPAR